MRVRDQFGATFKSYIEEDDSDSRDDRFLSCVRHLSIPKKAKLNVVGDTHGHLADVFTIFRLSGYPSQTNIYIWNGDLTDRCASLLIEIFFISFPHFS